MVSARTLSRQKKIKLLRQAHCDIIDILLFEHKDRDLANMRYYREIALKVKSLKNRTKPLEKINIK